MEERREDGSQNQEGRPAISRPPLLKQAYRYPWLVIIDRPDYTRQTFYCILHNRWYERNIKEMQNKLIVSSREGWLFLKDNETGDSSLFNMFTLEKLQVPEKLFIAHFYNSIVSSSPKMDNACRIISGWQKECLSYYLGDSDYKEQKFIYDSLGDVLVAVNFEGRLYCVTHGSWDLLVADFDDPELHFTPIIRGDRLFTMMLRRTNDIPKFYLIATAGEVLFVYTNHLGHDGLDIKIFKADLDKGEWVDFDLGDQALFLDTFKGLSVSKPSEFGLRGNCVYYVNTFKDRNLYAYDIKDGGITMTLPCPIVSNQDSLLFWAM